MRTDGAQPAISTAVTTLKCVAAFCLAAFFAYAFYVRYWKWRECIAVVESSCTEPGAGNATDGGRIWAVFAVAFLAWGISLVIRLRAKLRNEDPTR